MRFAGPFIEVLFLIFNILEWTIFIWVILSWLLFFASQSSFRWRNRGAYHLLEQLNDIFTRMTYPFLRPIRRLLRRFDTAGIDWSPLVLLLFIFLIKRLLVILLP